MTEARIVSSSRDRVGESPLWSPDEQALYRVDIEALHPPARPPHRHPAKLAHAAARGCIARGGWRHLLAAMETEIHHLAPACRRLCAAASSPASCTPRPNMRFNDGRCDHQGRLWVGTMSMDGTPAIRWAPGTDWTSVGSAPADRRPVHAQRSAFHRMAACSTARTRTPACSASGPTTTTPTRPARTGAAHRAPPGTRSAGWAAVDADGCYWICANDAGRVLRYSPSGQQLAGLEVPVPKPANVVPGGPQLDRLFVTSIQPAGARGPHGAVFELRPGVRTARAPLFPIPAASPDVPSASRRPRPCTRKTSRPSSAPGLMSFPLTDFDAQATSDLVGYARCLGFAPHGAIGAVCRRRHRRVLRSPATSTRP